MRGTSANYLLLVFLLMAGVYSLVYPEHHSVQIVFVMSQVVAVMFLAAWALYSSSLNQNELLDHLSRRFRRLYLLCALFQITHPYGLMESLGIAGFSSVFFLAHNIIAVLILYIIVSLFSRIYSDKYVLYDKLWALFFGIVVVATLLAGDLLTLRYGIYIFTSAMSGIWLIYITVHWSWRKRLVPHVCLQIFLVASLFLIINLNTIALGVRFSPWFVCILIFVLINSVNYRGMAIFSELMLTEQRKNLELVYRRDQIKPHFIYNTLTTIVTLIRRDSNKAIETIVDFSHLLRGLAKEGDKNGCVHLQRELEVLESYIKIQRIILPVPVDWQVCVEKKALRAAIPVFTLQTLVENTIKYALREGQTLRMKLVGSVLDNQVVLQLSDNGPGMTENGLEALFGSNSSGLGLINTRKRLQYIGGQIHVRNIAGGFEVVVELPYKCV